MSPRTWLLSGIPRSGTSLCCRLAGGLPDLVALSEPLRPHRQMVDCSDPHDACTRIEILVEQIRAGIRTERRAPSIQFGSHLDDNLAGSGRADTTGLRRLRAEWGEIPIDKPLSARFELLVKHNALFAALLPRLAVSFPFLALVRNPLVVLASWQTVDLPIHRGRIPVGERFDPELCRALDREPEPLRR